MLDQVIVSDGLVKSTRGLFTDIKDFRIFNA